MKSMLKLIGMMAVLISTTAILGQAGAKKGSLEGKIFEVEIQEPGKKAQKDQLIFKDGKFESKYRYKNSFPIIK